MKRLLVWLSDLRVAIVLLLLIALASAVGTAIPQGDPPASYLAAYAHTPWQGLRHGEPVLPLLLAGTFAASVPKLLALRSFGRWVPPISGVVLLTSGVLTLLARWA